MILILPTQAHDSMLRSAFFVDPSANTWPSECDKNKPEAHEQKHGVSFAETATAFGDPLSMSIADPDHSESEERFVLIGLSYLARIVVVIHR